MIVNIQVVLLVYNIGMVLLHRNISFSLSFFLRIKSKHRLLLEIHQVSRVGGLGVQIL
jgi:hypothetical protein